MAEPGGAAKTLAEIVDEFSGIEATIRPGGGPKAIDRQHAKGRLTARERIARLVDPPAKAASGDAPDPNSAEIPNFQELGLWAAHGMYAEYGGAPGAGVVTGIGLVHGRPHVIASNDATVKAGAFFPATCKKIIRAQHLARMARLPVIYLVDSAGVFLPLQEDVFPDTDDFGRVFYLNSVLSAEGVPQIAAVMGSCVAGGGYLPVLCDTLLMTEGSGMYLAGQALVKAAIGQEASDEELGGASMHAAISGTVDFKEPDDEACLRRIRELCSKRGEGDPATETAPKTDGHPPYRDPAEIYNIYSGDPRAMYDARDIIACVVDSRAGVNDAGEEVLEPDFDEFKAEYGTSLVCGYARIGGDVVGIVASQGTLTERRLPSRGGATADDGKPATAAAMPRVIYDDSAEKAARFVMECNQRRCAILFVQDTTGFMVGRDSEQSGIIKAGAKLVNAVSNSVVPKIVLVIGGSYGAGNYALCGRAFEPFLTLAWPASRMAVMGAAQAAGTLATIEARARARSGEEIDEAEQAQILAAVRASYETQQDIRHAASRGWIDRIIRPERTRDELIAALRATRNWDRSRPFKTGVFQV